ncbi:MAG: rhodanese-like domain-containing protein [Paracoccaceae bacterium]
MITKVKRAKGETVMQDQGTAKNGLSRRSVLGMAVLGAGVAAATFRYVRAAPEYEGGSLLVDEAYGRAVAGTITLIDIRRPDEWNATGVGEGAHPIDMRRDDFINALEQVAGPDRTQPIALICARGVRSARLSKRLTQAGFTQIIDVPEGMLGSAAGPGWLARDLPTWKPERAEG